LSGSGKSTVAAGIAPAIGPPPGARVLTSDRIRKRLSGVEPEARLPEAAYRSEMSERVYGTIMRDARDVLTLGHSVVADAVFDRPEDRARMAEAAKQAGVPFTGIWLDAPAATLIARVEGRQHDPSDATPDVLRAQLKRLTEKVEWTRINAGEDASSTQEAALEVIGRA
jgi:predicted kinase